MATNAFKETKLSSTICRISPPISPTRTHIRGATQHAPASSKPRSKLLATLDAEIPQWLAGPPPTQATVSSKTHLGPCNTSRSLSAMPASTTDRSTASGACRATTSKPFSNGHAKFIIDVVPLKRATSDIENQPEETAICTPPDTEDTNVSPTIPINTGTLPLYSYKQYPPVPVVVYTQHEEEANDLVQSLKGPIGFDLEWVVNFRRNRAPAERRTALVQLCDARMILLVQVSAMKKFPQKVKELIENKDVIKIGANIRNDGQKLFRDYGLLPANLVELGAFARQADPMFPQPFERSIVALAKVVERYTGKSLDKGKVRTSNWEAKLSQSQITYAANDAHCALVVFNSLVAMAKAHEREIVWEECSSDLEKVYRAKTVAAAAAPAVVAAIPQEEEEEEEESDCATISTPVTAAGGKSASGSLATASPTPLIRTSSAPSATAGSSTSNTLCTRKLVYSGEIPGSISRSTSAGVPRTSSRTTLTQGAPPRPQHLRAYNLWHHRHMDLRDICAALRSKENPLAESTVISYVVRALQADASLPFSMDRLKAFVQLEAGSWMRHRDWILQMDGYKK